MAHEQVYHAQHIVGSDGNVRLAIKNLLAVLCAKTFDNATLVYFS